MRFKQETTETSEIILNPLQVPDTIKSHIAVVKNFSLTASASKSSYNEFKENPKNHKQTHLGFHATFLG